MLQHAWPDMPSETITSAKTVNRSHTPTCGWIRVNWLAMESLASFASGWASAAAYVRAFRDGSTPGASRGSS
jgi:hypothetical protein